MPSSYTRASAAMTRRTWIFVIAVALLVCYAPVVRGMYSQWISDEDMGHALAVPFVIAWVLWRERTNWQRVPARPSGWGLILLAIGAVLQIGGSIGVGLFVASIGLLVSVAGLVVWLHGFGLLRAWAFPFFLALFMLPKLAIVYVQVTFPLQLFTSKLATAGLAVGGVHVIREGNILDVGGHRISVVEACSGIRYLLSLGFVAIVFGYVSHPKLWMRVALLVAAVPVAILANAVRVALTGLIPALDSGVLHSFAGWLVFVVCLGSLALVRVGLSRGPLKQRA